VRPTAEPQSALRTPLNQVLATEGNVRILRVLAAGTTPLGKSEVARRAGLNPTGVRRSLVDLIDCGVVQPVGVGRRQLVRMNDDHPLAVSLRHLFESECGLLARLVQDLRADVRALDPPPTAAWIQGPVATASDRRGDSIVVGLLAPAGSIDRLARELERRIIDIMRRHDVIVEVLRWTPADLVSVPASWPDTPDETILLLGPPPSALRPPNEGKKPTRGGRIKHPDRDRQALELARIVADQLAEDPSLVDAAHEFVVKRIESASESERSDLEEWRLLLERLSIGQLRRFLVGTGERATRLRQSLPFVNVKLSRERRLATQVRENDSE